MMCRACEARRRAMLKALSAVATRLGVGGGHDRTLEVHDNPRTTEINTRLTAQRSIEHIVDE